MGTTTGELGLTTYSAGDEPWSHSTGLSTIDDKVSDLMHGKLRDAVAVSSLASQPDLTSGQKGAGVLDVSATSGTLSNIANGTDEQFLWVYFSGATTPTVEHGTDADDISLKRAADWTPSQYDFLLLWYDGDNSIWREVTSSARYIGQSQLSTATTSGAISRSSTVSFIGGQYSFAPVCTGTGPPGGTLMGNGLYNPPITGFSGSLSYTIRYMQSTPPWYVDGEEWGAFIYLHRNKSDGSVISSCVAEDPSWYQGGESLWPKHSLERIAEVPHPFVFNGIAGGKPPVGTEVVLVDNREHDLVPDLIDVSKIKAERLRLEAEKVGPGNARKIAGMMERASKLEEKPREVAGKEFVLRRWKSLARKQSVWEMLEDKPSITEASDQAMKDGKPLKTGCPEFDSVVTIVRKR